MTLIGLDLNASRARALHGPAGSSPLPLRLEEDQRDLPLAVSLAERRPVVGRAGLRLCRRQPQFACLDFLPHLGSSRRWTVGRHNLDSSAALALVLDKLQKSLVRCEGAALALPAYLREEQVNQIVQQAEKARVQVLGTVPTPLAAARWAFQRQSWGGVALVGDVDGGAFTWSAVCTEGGQARLLAVQSLPRLARSAWLLRVLDGIADRCIRLSRRDPRQVPEAEQALFDQTVMLLNSPLGSGLIEMKLRTAGWSQHMLFQPAEMVACCASLVQQAVRGLRQTLAGLLNGASRAQASQVAAQVVLLTAPAACLPGLATALTAAFEKENHPRPAQEHRDFGEGLFEMSLLPGEVHSLDADAVAAGAHDLASQIQRGEQMPGYADCVRLSIPEAVDDGPARLQFRGQDHPLDTSIFTLGRDLSCNLVLEEDLYPEVAPFHCEIYLDRRAYTLRDRSRLGTLVNDRPVTRLLALNSGDWIRLGPEGPVLRFVGQPLRLRTVPR